MKTRLSKEEKEILESFEKGEWTSAENLSERKKALAEYARNTLKKDKRLNIRISERDLLELQKKAVQEGLPYQTYVSSIIHKFLNGTMPLIGFGTFSVAARKARTGRNPRTGKGIKIAAKKVPKFSAGAALKAAAAGKAVPTKPKAKKAAVKPKKK